MQRNTLWLSCSPALMFARLYREHRELLRQTGSHSVSEDIEHELQQLVKKMESKEDQISKLKKHQDSVRTFSHTHYSF